MSKPVKADSWMSLAADMLAGAAYHESGQEHSCSDVVPQLIATAFDYARNYERDWVYDFIYDPAWQEKNRIARQQRADAVGAGY